MILLVLVFNDLIRYSFFYLWVKLSCLLLISIQFSKIELRVWSILLITRLTFKYYKRYWVKTFTFSLLPFSIVICCSYGFGVSVIFLSSRSKLFVANYKFYINFNVALKCVLEFNIVYLFSAFIVSVGVVCSCRQSSSYTKRSSHLSFKYLTFSETCFRVSFFFYYTQFCE